MHLICPQYLLLVKQRLLVSLMSWKYNLAAGDLLKLAFDFIVSHPGLEAESWVLRFYRLPFNISAYRTLCYQNHVFSC